MSDEKTAAATCIRKRVQSQVNGGLGGWAAPDCVCVCSTTGSVTHSLIH